jgi:hypothetical protein
MRCGLFALLTHTGNANLTLHVLARPFVREKEQLLAKVVSPPSPPLPSNVLACSLEYSRGLISYRNSKASQTDMQIFRDYIPGSKLPGRVLLKIFVEFSP